MIRTGARDKPRNSSLEGRRMDSKTPPQPHRPGHRRHARNRPGGAALGLARAGAHVIALGRTQGGLEALDDQIFAETGVSTPPSYRSTFARPEGLDASGRHDPRTLGSKLDILVHAAAVLGGITPTGHIEPKKWNETLAVNLTASWRLIRVHAEPLLKASDRRAGHLPDLRAASCASQGVLGGLCGQQGGHGGAGALLGRRGGEHDRTAPPCWIPRPCAPACGPRPIPAKTP